MARHRSHASRTHVVRASASIGRHLITGMLVAISVAIVPTRVTPRLGAAEKTLAGTDPLTVERPLDELMVEGLTRYGQRQLAVARDRRVTNWSRIDGATMNGPADRDARRTRFRERIGAVDARLTADRSQYCRFEYLSSVDGTSVVARSRRVTVHAIRWPVLAGITAEGLLLVPQDVHAGLVAVPDADWTPEMFVGLEGDLPPSVQLARRLAESGCLVAIPTLISRSDKFSGHPEVRYTNQPHREFLYRQAFEVGRHVIGYEAQKVLAAIDLLEQHAERRSRRSDGAGFHIGVAGVGEGGLLALYSAALDARIRSCLVSGYFETREEVWREPIYRNVWGLLTEFGDAELAGLIAPRRLVIEACRSVEVAGPPAAREGRAQVAAPGRIVTCPPTSVRAEFARATEYFRDAKAESEIKLAMSGDDGTGPAGTRDAIQAFAAGLGVTIDEHLILESWSKSPTKAAPEQPSSDRHTPDLGTPEQETSKPPSQPTMRPESRRAAEGRQRRQFDELQTHVQKLLHDSHRVRDARWRAASKSVDEWAKAGPQLRDWVHAELIGRVTEPRLKTLRPRSRRVVETNEYIGYEVRLDVFDDVIAAGVLLLPKDIAADEKRPVVVCQHGLEGTPLDTMTHDGRAYASYKAFSESLVKRGFIVYAPQNPYRGGDRFRVLQRMANPLGRSLFSYVIAQHEQTLDWLGTLPQVDARRLAFYGLSYGGKTAMRVPPLVDRYSLSICSGDFTDWPRTIAANDEKFSYAFTTEYEVPEWNLAHVASYAELAMLMFPRPFMVEAGHRDGGQPTEWVAGEFGKVRRHYDQLGGGDRAEIEFFDGPHTINGQATFRFLFRHLR